MGGTIRFHDLGALTLERDGTPVPVGGARLVAALGLLLVHAGRPVSVDALAEAMWGGETTPRSASTLDSHIWRLRRLLEPDRGRGAPAELLLRDAAGYRLLATTDQVDSMRFARLADETVDLLTAAQPERALRRADEAVALWRGRPFTPHSDEPWARPAVARLEELHGQVRERRIEALLAVGDPERALVELEPAIAADPLRERLWTHRMLAAYRCGRTDQALTTYRDARELLLDELGVEPGPELRELHRRILADDATLRGPARGPSPAPKPGVYDGAVAADNSFAAWMASEAAVNAALTGGDVESGLRWSDRMIAQHRALRVREGPTLLELRADLLALAGDAPAAVRLFAAARAHNQRAGMRWPNREITAGLLARAGDELDRVEFEDAWQEGTRLTLDDLGAAVAGRAGAS